MRFNHSETLAWLSPRAQATSPNAPLHCLCFTESCDGRGPFMVPQVSAAPRKMTVQRSTFMMIYFSQSLLSNGNSFAGVPDPPPGLQPSSPGSDRGGSRAFAGSAEESGVRETDLRSTESWLMLMIPAQKKKTYFVSLYVHYLIIYIVCISKRKIA